MTTPTITAMDPVELLIDCSEEENVRREVVVQLSGDMFLAARAINEGSGTPEAGSLMVLSDLDGEGLDRLIVNPARSGMRAAQIRETLQHAHEAIEVAIEALGRLEKAGRA